MEAAAYDYCERWIKFGRKHVILPMIFYWFQSDFLRAPNSQKVDHLEEEEELLEDNTADERVDQISLDEIEKKGDDKDDVPNPLFTIGWLTKKQTSRITKMVQEGNYKIAYEYDWTPSLM